MSDDPNIGFHQGGAHLPARTFGPRNAQALRFRIGGKWVYAKKVTIPAANIPARLVLFIAETDHAKAVQFLLEQIKKLINAGWQYVPASSLEAA
jgi:hypothetical protein